MLFARIAGLVAVVCAVGFAAVQVLNLRLAQVKEHIRRIERAGVHIIVFRFLSFFLENEGRAKAYAVRKFINAKILKWATLHLNHSFGTNDKNRFPKDRFP